MTHASISELMNEIREHTIDGQSTISTLSEVQKEEITITSIDKLQIVLNESVFYLMKGDSDVEVQEFIDREKIDVYIEHM